MDNETSVPQKSVFEYTPHGVTVHCSLCDNTYDSSALSPAMAMLEATHFCGWADGWSKRDGRPICNDTEAHLRKSNADLLAACESALWLMIELDASGSAQWEVKDQLRAVIARAKGETDARDNS